MPDTTTQPLVRVIAAKKDYPLGHRIVQALPPNAFGIDPNDFFLA